jgi:hypothetical protein
MTEDGIAYTAAINVLRDTIESGRLPLEPDAAALHERAARHLEKLRADLREKIQAGEPSA